MADAQFIEDFSAVREGLAQLRLGEPPLLDHDTVRRLAAFVEVVLASAPELEEAGRPILRVAAQIAQALAETHDAKLDVPRYRLKTALLHELADEPMMA